MALDKKVFQIRARTAIAYAIVMLTGLLWNEWSFFILFSIVHFGCWYEYQKLAVRIDSSFDATSLLNRIFFPLFGWGFLLVAVSDHLVLMGIPLNKVGYQLIRWGGYFLPILFIINRNFSVRHLARSMGGVVYISLFLALLINLRSGWIWMQGNSSDAFTSAISGFSGKLVALLMVVSIWINDTMAYLVGSWIGKTPLTKWSPKKTWEGTVGGIVLSAGLIWAFAFFRWEANYEVLIIASTAAVAGTFGDLLESRLKRLAQVKDSGTFLPGHGGFLDRFDSILLAAPAVWLIAYLLYR